MRKYSEGPRRGIKQCPDCKRFMGVRTYVCECGYDFGATKKLDAKPQAVTVTIFDAPGRGRKPCKCGKFLPVRSQSCPCGHVFSKDDPVQEERVESPAQKFAKSIGCGHYKIVLTPAGKCPVKLTGTGQYAVREWAENVMTNPQDGQFFAPEALRAWISQFYPRYVSGTEGLNPQYVEACTSLSQYLETLVNEHAKED